MKQVLKYSAAVRPAAVQKTNIGEMWTRLSSKCEKDQLILESSFHNCMFI